MTVKELYESAKANGVEDLPLSVCGEDCAAAFVSEDTDYILLEGSEETILNQFDEPELKQVKILR